VLTAAAGGGRIWGDLLTHNYRIGTDYFQAFVIVNKAAFAKLSPKAQAALKDAVREVAPQISTRMAREENETLDGMKAKGMVVTIAKPEEVVEATKRMAPVWAEWAKAKGPEHERALAEVRAAIGK